MKERAGTIRISIVLLTIAVLGTFSIWEVKAGQETTSSQTEKLARVTLTDTVHDFGKVIQGEKPVATFTLCNTGDDVLEIHHVMADIRNITTVVPRTSLNPGEQGSIRVTLDSTGLHDNVVGRISVFTNDEERPEVFLQVRARVQPILALNPPFVFVGRVSKDGSFSGKVEVVGELVDEGRLRAITIHTSSPAIEAGIRQRGPKDATLEFVLLPEQKAGSFEESITLASKDPPAQARLPLYGQKLGDIRFTPDRFEFFPKKGVKPHSRSVLFECDKPFKIIKVEDLSGLLNLTITIIEEGKKYELVAKLKKWMEGGFLGVVKVHTDLEEHPLIHIPVIGGGG